jgi:ankyrin repeat protein
MLKSLPSRPNLEQLKKQAKDLLKAARASVPAALQRFVQHHPAAPQPGGTAAGFSAFTLSDAQLVVARELGFKSWPDLKEQVESMQFETEEPLELLKKAFHADDAPQFRRLLNRFPEAKAWMNQSLAAFDAPLVTQARSRQMLDVLLEAGVDINAKSRWWAGGFGLLHTAEPSLAAYAIERGAMVDVHAAARLGMLEKLRNLLDADPALVHARGGDGQTPLHFASTVAIARLLLDRGADIDALDIDHESTPAQYMVRDRQEPARYLVGRGCRTDLLMAAALGDVDLVIKHLATDSQSIHLRVTPEFFPMRNPKAGGTIYQWTLGWNVSPHDAARQFGRDEVYALLMSRSPAEVKLLAACWGGDEAAARSLVAGNPRLAASFSDTYRCEIAHAARNNNTAAVQAMLSAGLSVIAVGQHHGTPLHWAAFHGNAEMTRTILGFNPPLEALDADFHSTPLGWAIHGSQHGWHRTTGDYPMTVRLLLEAGAAVPLTVDRGTPAVQAILRQQAAGASPAA